MARLGWLLAAIVITSGCVSVGTRVCGMNQPGCDFTDHVLTTWPNGRLCPTWNVRFAGYQPNGQPTDTYGVAQDDALVATLRKASDEDKPVHVWYAGENLLLYASCKSDYPLVIYRAEIEG